MIRQDPIPLEDRVSQLEQEVRRLKSRLPDCNDEMGWLASFDGVLEDDALTAEAERLGREWRKSQQDGANEP
ncbi:hypothetical protein [Stieleria varia]|uniref:Uncharacterized protein n=1 Tax=Stieleria varia TaxID=2528005 RepID=A0A5C6B8Q4_9BACT|nr:hypothetical protein [Stieleria varia]TWU08340.1 hypothetical protein Pla52n_09220 [Stieleria varia]